MLLFILKLHDCISYLDFQLKVWTFNTSGVPTTYKSFFMSSHSIDISFPWLPISIFTIYSLLKFKTKNKRYLS